MKETQIHTSAELHEIIETYDARTVIYRGMKSMKNLITLNGSDRREINGSGDDPAFWNTERNHYSTVNTVPVCSNL